MAILEGLSAWGVYLVSVCPGGCLPMGYLPRGMPAYGDVCLGGVCLEGCLPGECLPKRVYTVCGSKNVPMNSIGNAVNGLMTYY